MLNHTLASDYAIWLVAMLLYVVDAAKLLSPRELLLTEAPHGRLASSFNENPFTITGRALRFAPLFLPYRGVFVASWGRTWATPEAFAATFEPLRQLRRSLLIVRVVATLAFVLLFGLGPLLTLWLGPSAAIVYTAGVLYLTLIFAIASLWWKRGEFRLTVKRAAWLSIDLLVCPAFLPNMVRKITVLQPIEADGAQILVASAPSEAIAEIVSLLEGRTEELIEDTGTDNLEQEHLRSYLAALRAAR